MTDYQKQLLKQYMTIDLEAVTQGWKAGEVMVMYGRQSGKSMLNSYYGNINQMKPIPFSKVDSYPVDGETWYTVALNKESSIWFRETQASTEDKLWYEHLNPNDYFPTNKIDMHEKLFTLVQLKWS